MIGQGLLDKSRGWAAQHAARLWFNHHFASLGIMTTLEIDPRNKTLRADLDLKGENSPISIEVRGYALIERDGRTFLEVGEVETSREWLTALANQFLKGRRIELPAVLKAAL
jgi:hypothetical protein